MRNYSVDIPDPYNPEGPWVHIMLSSKEQALRFVQNKFGADEEGNINLLTEMAGEEDE